MPNIFKISISHQTFEQSYYSRNTLEKTYEGCEIYDIENIPDFRIKFIDYIKENGNYVGAILSCDYGHGYGFDIGWKNVNLTLGNVYHFTHMGTSVDDSGCPEDFSIEYYICLHTYD